MRNLSLIGRVQIFKTIGFSKILYLASVANVPTRTVEEPNSIQNNFIRKSKTPKIRHSTSIADYQDGDIKMLALQPSLKLLSRPGPEDFMITVIHGKLYSQIS